ncbi:MAG: hypothetical protein ACI8QD_002622 [Cyclobacteriaceae bacterium]|jgi:hypothetical protein
MRRPTKKAFSWVIGCTIICGCFLSCENRPLHDNQVVRPRELHEDIEFHFDEIMVDGVEYLILEKDNNNPHEGFGFMAFRGNRLLQKQDTILAYMRTATQMQTLIYAKLYNKSLEESRELVNQVYSENLRVELDEISQLEQRRLSSILLANPDSAQSKED